MPFSGVFVPHVPVITNQDSAPVVKRRSAFGAARKAGAHHTPSELINQEVSRPERTTIALPARKALISLHPLTQLSQMNSEDSRFVTVGPLRRVLTRFCHGH
jgi:hypothetical protein